MTFLSALTAAANQLPTVAQPGCRTFLLANFPIRSIIQKVEYMCLKEAYIHG
jgi:hypothetical protein